MVCEEVHVRITLQSGTACELTRPASGDAIGGLVVIPDIFGLRPLFDDLCRQLADARSLVVAAVEPFPDLDLPDIESRFAALPSLSDNRLLGDVVAAANATEMERVCLIGFCMGGMYTLKAAALGRFARVCAFYGMIRVPKDWRGPGHGEPLDAVSAPGATPAMAVIGEKDQWTPPADVAALAASGVRIASYPEADHGFVHDASRPTHRPHDAADAWRQCWEFLEL
jgi:carboxymethylenebutenolidase